MATLFSELSKIYTINPTTGALSARIINGNGKNQEGDLAFVRTESYVPSLKYINYNWIKIYASTQITNGLGSFTTNI
jgi:hypothetical protein